MLIAGQYHFAAVLQIVLYNLLKLIKTFCSVTNLLHKYSVVDIKSCASRQTRNNILMLIHLSLSRSWPNAAAANMDRLRHTYSFWKHKQNSARQKKEKKDQSVQLMAIYSDHSVYSCMTNNAGAALLWMKVPMWEACAFGISVLVSRLITESHLL